MIWLLFAFCLLVMLVGVLGNMIPGIPGTPLILGAGIAFRLFGGEGSVDNWVLIAMVLITVFALALDYIAGMIGAKKLGATWKGVCGAVVGGIVGLFFNLPGIILGPIIGAVSFEMIGGRKFKEAGRAGLGAFIGMIAGAFGKVICSLVMIGLFTFNVLWPDQEPGLKPVSPIVNGNKMDNLPVSPLFSFVVFPQAMPFK